MNDSMSRAPGRETPHTGRFLTTHMVNGCNDHITINVVDQPGPGNANHEYVVNWPGTQEPTRISFQNGPIKESGVNGLTNEALLAILIDRMKGFQAGPYASDDNQKVLDALQTAHLWSMKRTLDRVSRGVEGTHKQ